MDSPSPNGASPQPSSPSGKRCSCPRVKRWTTGVTIAAFFLAGGIEYSVIFPTMWDYLRGMGGQEWMYGLALSAFSISNLFAGPVYGLVFDFTHQTKLIILVANLFEIGGNFMYFSATSKYMIVGSRFIVGLGAGAGATLFGELARISTKKERTKVFSIFSAFRQLGLIFGPAFNLFLRKLHVDIGPFLLDKLTAPGAVMTVVWVILELMFLFLFYQLPSAIEPVQQQGNGDDTKPDSSTPHQHSTTGSSCEKEEKSDRHLHKQSNRKLDGQKRHFKSLSKSAVRVDASTGESTPLLGDPGRNTSHYSVNIDTEKSSQDLQDGNGLLAKAGRYIVFVASRMVLEEIVVLLAVLFLTVFSQTAIETMLVPMAEVLLDWTERDTSIFFSCAGVELIVGILVVFIMSRWVGDRWLLLVGLTLSIFGYAWMLGWLGSGSRDIPDLLVKFICGAVPIIFALPFFFVAGASLYSKLLPMQVQGIGQGLRRSVFSTAAILGPLWAGGALAFSTYYILLGVPLALLIFVTILVILSFVRLKEPKERHVLLP